ncbi:MAG: hypothetical protein ACREI3_09760 [Nitrospirales bacterium]
MHELFLTFLERLRSDPRTQRFDESATKQALILPLLQMLGWNTADIDEVTPDWETASEVVSYALQVTGHPAVLMFVQPAREPLDAHPTPFLTLCLQQETRLAVATNGVAWWVYALTAEGPRRARLVHAINVKHQQSSEVVTILHSVLSKRAVASGAAFQHADALCHSRERTQWLQQAMASVWNRLLTEPSDELVALLGQHTQDLCGVRPAPKDILVFLTTHQPKLLLPRSPAVGGRGSKPAPQSAVPAARRARTAAATNAQQETPVDPALVHQWATRLAHHVRYPQAQDRQEAKALLEELAVEDGLDLRTLPVGEIVERAGNLYFFTILPRQSRPGA